VPILKEYAYHVECLYMDSDIDCTEFRNRVDAVNPAIVGFSSTSHQLRYLIRYAGALESLLDVIKIAGGVGPTLAPEDILKKSAIQGVCVGEGEIPLRNLLNNIERSHDVSTTEGFYWKVNSGIKRNVIPRFVDDLSTLSFPDYTVFDKGKVAVDRNPCRLKILLSRGCPYACPYCCNEALSGVYSQARNYFRVPSVNYSIRLVKRMVALYPEIEFIDFGDDNLTAHVDWLKEFAEEYRKKIGIPYRINARPEHITPDFIETLKSSNCARVHIGLESGNERLRKTILNRGYSNAFFIKKCRMVKTAGFHLHTYNMVGLPFEGPKEMYDTFKLNKKINADSGACYFFCPYKGTSLYTLCEKNNLLKEDEEMMMLPNYTSRPFIAMSSELEKISIYYKRIIEQHFYMKTEFKTEVNKGSPGKGYFFYLKHWLRWQIYQRLFLYKALRQLRRLLRLQPPFRGDSVLP